MKVTPDDYGRRCQFDHFCKLVLYHEAVDYFRERKRQRGWETSFDNVPAYSTPGYTLEEWESLELE